MTTKDSAYGRNLYAYYELVASMHTTRVGMAVCKIVYVLRASYSY